jgi:diguanylate cyclase (GGDEF)-like protein/PAS domain S-box-containing protein
MTLRFWGKGHHGVMLAILGGLIAVAISDMAVYLHRRRIPKDTPVSDRAMTLLCARMGVEALLYAGLALFTFNVGDAAERQVVTAVLGGVIATGSWLFACLPEAGTTWVVVLCGGICVGLPATLGASQMIIVVLLLFFGLVMLAMVFSTSRLLLVSLASEFEVDRQKQLLGLLLDDFEENASDFMWEVDSKGLFQRVSMKLAAVVGSTPDKMVGHSIYSLLSWDSTDLRPDELALLHELKQTIQRREPFRDLIVPARVNGEQRWWTLTAKPLPDGSGSHGWRGVGTDITALRQRELEMVHLANFDALTGLANRHQFGHHLKKNFVAANGDPLPCTLLLIDLDDFKAINDTLGHDAGDRLLQELARRLTASAPSDHLLCRLGGDEFAIVAPTALGREVAERLALTLQAAMSEPFVLDGHRIQMNTSIGIGSSPADAPSAEALLKLSDMAMYAAKAAGRNAVRFFDASMDERAKHHLGIVTDMTNGLARGEFELYYQPQTDLNTNAVIGFEALIRWNHPTRGLVSPLDFIPIAEESGLIIPLGAWVLSKACADATRWPSHLNVAVNVSAKQFSGSDLVKVVQGALRESGLESHRLEVEITESTLIDDSRAALLTLKLLRQLGVKIALDDFGTGYSSLSYLRNFPLDKVKVDRSFIEALAGSPRSPENTAIVSAIVQLAETFRFETIAEGIETDAQRQVLRDIGCGYGQGFLIARPMDPAQMREYLTSNAACEAPVLVS